jgi:MFS family permease
MRIERMHQPIDTTPQGWRNVPRSVWALGFVSLLMDTSSELIHSLLPVFLVTALGASPITVGIIEGIAEATASLVKIFSGVLSDRMGKRKVLAVLGYGLGALSKPLFPLAATAAEVFAARFIDRIGKGIRGAPRDALVADVTPIAIRGAAYGVRQALDTIGAFAGPLLAIALMALYADDFRTVFWWAVIPGGLAVLVLIFGVQEPEGVKPTRTRGWSIQKAQFTRLPRLYWLVIAIGVMLTLARFSEAFLVLKAQSAGLPLALIPLVLVCMNIVYSLTAIPAGTLSDRAGRPRILLIALAALVTGDLVLAFGPGLTAVFAGIALWGLHMGLSQGLLAALVADTAPADLRGTAFGFFNLVTGGALLIASVLAGWLWQVFGPDATFLAGAAFAATTALIIAMRFMTPFLDGARHR